MKIKYIWGALGLCAVTLKDDQPNLDSGKQIFAPISGLQPHCSFGSV